MASAANARRTLETGVTTVRDLGAANYADIALRDAINAGTIVRATDVRGRIRSVQGH